MKRLLVFLILFFCHSVFADGKIVESKPKKIWIVAPGIWDLNSPELPRYLQQLQSYLQKSSSGPITVELKTARGFIVQQYFNLQKELQKSQPDWIFYVQRGDFFPYDLRELLHSKTRPHEVASIQTFSVGERDAQLPGWTASALKSSIFSSLKEAMFLERRIKKEWRKATNIADLKDLTIRMSFFPAETLKQLVEGKAKLVFLISPERIEFQNNLFPGNDFGNILARTYFMTVNIDRATLKNQLANSGLDYALLPKEYGELSQSENLMAGSAFILNSTGVLRSFQILTPIISDYLRAEEGSR